MPGLSAFMLSAWAAKSGMPAAARKWSLEPAASRFTLTLAPSNRWCPPPHTHTHITPLTHAHWDLYFSCRGAPVF